MTSKDLVAIERRLEAAQRNPSTTGITVPREWALRQSSVLRKLVNVDPTIYKVPIDTNVKDIMAWLAAALCTQLNFAIYIRKDGVPIALPLQEHPMIFDKFIKDEDKGAEIIAATLVADRLGAPDTCLGLSHYCRYISFHDVRPAIKVPTFARVYACYLDVSVEGVSNLCSQDDPFLIAEVATQCRAWILDQTYNILRKQFVDKVCLDKDTFYMYKSKAIEIMITWTDIKKFNTCDDGEHCDHEEHDMQRRLLLIARDYAECP